jgi:hypothetical protein
MMFMKKTVMVFCCMVLPALFSVSCIGLSADIAVHKNGSVTAVLEYHIAEVFESLGKLDGNARWLPIPAGRADFERSADRIEGMKLRSFNTKKSGGQVINRVKLEFSNTVSFLKFFDALGQSASFSRENGQNRLSLSYDVPSLDVPSLDVPSDGRDGEIEAELAELVRELCSGYSLELRFSLPSDGELVLLNSSGETLPAASFPASWKIVNGRNAVFSVPAEDLLLSAETIRVELRWK